MRYAIRLFVFFCAHSFRSRLFGVNVCQFKAKRAGIKTIILPNENVKDYNELQDFIKDGMEIHFAKNYEDVFSIIFPSSNTPTANTASN